MNETLETSAVAEEAIACVKCGATLSREQNFCPTCGYRVEAEAKRAVTTTAHAKKKKSKKYFVSELVKNSVVLALAILMLVAAFLPIVQFGLDPEENFGMEDIEEPIYVRFGAIDGISMLISSFSSLDEEELEEEYEELGAFAEENEDEWFEGEEMDQLARYIKKMLSLGLKSEDVKTSPSMVIVAILSVVQILLALCLLAFAALSFAATFLSSLKKFPKLPFILLGWTVIVMLTNAFALGNEFGLHTLKVQLTALQIWIAILSFLVMMAFMVLRFVVDREKIKTGTLVKTLLSLTFSVVILLSAFAPIVGTEVKVQFSNYDSPKKANSTLDGAVFYDTVLSDEYMETLDDMTLSQKKDLAETRLSMLENYKKREFEKGEAAAVNRSSFVSILFLYESVSENSPVFLLGAVAMIFVVLASLVLVWQNLYELATGRRMLGGIPLSAKILAIAMAVAILTFAIVMVVLVNYSARELDMVYHARLAYGPVVMLVSAVATICIPAAIPKAKRQRKEVVCAEAAEI